MITYPCHQSVGWHGLRAALSTVVLFVHFLHHFCITLVKKWQQSLVHSWHYLSRSHDLHQILFTMSLLGSKTWSNNYCAATSAAATNALNTICIESHFYALCSWYNYCVATWTGPGGRKVTNHNANWEQKIAKFFFYKQPITLKHPDNTCSKKFNTVTSARS